MTHLEALNLRLSNERARLATAKTSCERNQRAVWVAQIEREIAGEMAFLAKVDDLPEMSDDELLAALVA
jgi:hypothetical protein